MGLTITAKNLEVTSSIRQFVEEKFDKFIKKVDENSEVRITLGVDKERQFAEVLLYVGNSLIKVDTVDKNLYIAIDKIADKANYQINKALGKSNQKQHNSIRYEFYDEAIDEFIEGKRPIVKRKQFGLKPMFEEEAILQMELLKHSFFFFFNAETETTCLLYKRKDGNYGLIESLYK